MSAPATDTPSTAPDADATANEASVTVSEPLQPIIDPTNFDVIISGTGLPESLLAAAISSAGHSVLHLDPNPFYGSHFASVPLSHFVETSNFVQNPNAFLLDLAGPRLLYCADDMIEILLRSGASHHVEFKSVDSTLIYYDGGFCSVPDSRQAVFTDRTLRPLEKRKMTKFLMAVQQHIASDGIVEDGAKGFDNEDLGVSFDEFLGKQGLPDKIRKIILYAIALADYDQESGASCKKLIMAKEGIERLALYSKSVARFPNAKGAFIYPIYGHGELPQAFCRCAAVKGALYILRMSVLDVLTDEETKKYKGVRLASGQDIFSEKLVTGPSFQVPSLPSHANGVYEGLNSSNSPSKVARSICITNSSIQKGSSNVLVIFPPKSLFENQVTTIRALQLSSDVAVCPQGLFVVYLSTPCEDPVLGKQCIKTAMEVLFLEDTDESENTCVSTNNEDSHGEKKPVLKWKTTYIHELAQASLGDVISCRMPDESLDYRSILESTKKIFAHMYPGDEFFPERSTLDNNEDDNGSSD